MARKSKKIKDEEKALLSSVKSLKNHTASIITATHGIAFTVFFIAEKLLDYYLYPLFPSGPLKIFFIAIIASVLYPSIYFLTKLLCDKFIDISQKQYDIQGVWYHIHIPHTLGDVDYSRKMLRCGKSVIKRDLYDFTISALNSNYCVKNGKACAADDLNTTTWNTVISEISDSTEAPFDIIQIYNASTSTVASIEIDSCPCCENKFDTPKTIVEAERFRYGIHKLTIDKTSYKNKVGYTRINAQYLDCWPSLKSGELKFFKSERERDKCIEAYFATKESHSSKQ
ncbi:MAG: hypothetical protein IJZ75_04995 [Clostridia bacterium]|nr:hypothetical protein [Clostridia bacterium]